MLAVGAMSSQTRDIYPNKTQTAQSRDKPREGFSHGMCRARKPQREEEIKSW